MPSVSASRELARSPTTGAAIGRLQSISSGDMSSCMSMPVSRSSSKPSSTKPAYPTTRCPWRKASSFAFFLESGYPCRVHIHTGSRYAFGERFERACEVAYHRCRNRTVMGMGMGSAIGAAVATGKSVVAIEGDSAFGFSGMDFCYFCEPILMAI